MFLYITFKNTKKELLKWCYAKIINNSNFKFWEFPTIDKNWDGTELEVTSFRTTLGVYSPGESAYLIIPTLKQEDVIIKYDQDNNDWFFDINFYVEKHKNNIRINVGSGAYFYMYKSKTLIANKRLQKIQESRPSAFLA